jgi:predicted nucleic acid-binding protein
VTALWDTSVVSRLQPEGPVLEYVLSQAVADDPVAVASVALLEVAYGYQGQIRDPRFRALLDWLTHLLESNAFRAVSLDGRASLVAGRVRAELPHPPRARRGDRRSKTMRQAAWLLDIEIAATAYMAGLDLATENRGDFESIAQAIEMLFPRAEPLVVVGPLV